MALSGSYVFAFTQLGDGTVKHIVAGVAARGVGARVCGLLGGGLFLASCATTEPKVAQPVGIHLTSNASSAASTASTPLQIAAVRLVVTTASLGSGDQFGCVDCQGNAEDAPSTPKLVTVPAAGGTVLVATEQAAPGRYSEAEISVEQPTSATLAGTNWPAGATIVVDGTYRGATFQLPLSIVGSFRETLNPALDVAATGAPATAAITITLPVISWFQSNGVALDPNDPTQRATIVANAQRSFQALDTEGKAPEREP